VFRRFLSCDLGHGGAGHGREHGYDDDYSRIFFSAIAIYRKVMGMLPLF
jgi:hypothetical protein